jgi:UDP-glucuronate 4-epimerase
MTILVTGASGFVGAALCAELVTTGHRVVGVDAIDPSAQFLAAIAPAEDNFRFVRADLRQRDALAQAFAADRIDRVVIGAAVTADRRREQTDPSGVIAVNVGAVAETIRCAAEAKVARIVHLSSGAVYGDSARELPELTETTPLKARTLYGITKQAGEATALRLGTSLEADVVVGRLGTCFGRFERTTGVRDTVSPQYQILQQALACEPVRLPRPGYRDWLYVEDAVAGIVSLLETPRLTYSVYNLAAGFYWSIAEFCEVLTAHIPSLRWSIDADATVDLYEDFDRAPMSVARLIGDTPYRPRYDLQTAVADLMSHRSNPVAREQATTVR